MNLAGLSAHIDDIIAKFYLQTKFQLHNKPLNIVFVNGRLFIYDVAHKSYVNGLNGIDQFLQHFGWLFPVIDLSGADDSDTDNQFRLLGEVIEKHCRHTLTKIIFNHDADGIIQYWQKPFDQLEVVHFSIEHNLTNVANIFPNLRTMNVRLIEDLSYENFYFKNLERVNYAEFNYSTNRTFLKCLFHANPHLKHFETKAVLNLDIMQFMAANLHELEHLEIISYTSDDIESINARFTNVRTFVMASYRFSTFSYKPFALAFDRLESFELTLLHLSREVIMFILGNENLQHLSLAFTSITGPQLKELIEGLPNLESIIVRWTLDMKVDELRDALFATNGSRTLKSVTIKPSLDVDVGPFLGAIPSREWNVETCQSVGLQIKLERIMV